MASIVLKTSIVQITNIAPSTTLDQLRTLFGHIGPIDKIVLYPEEDKGESISKVGYIRFKDIDSAGVALHLNNTVFLDRALVVLPLADDLDQIPQESFANLVRAPMYTTAGVPPRSAEWPVDVISLVVGKPGEQVIMTIDPRLTTMGLPPYPPLPATTDSSKIEEIRRTVLVTNLDQGTTSEQVLEFFGVHAEVRFVRVADSETERAAYVEFTHQNDVAKAFQLMGATLNNKQIMVQHSTTPITKLSTVVGSAFDEAAKRVKEAESLISGSVEKMYSRSRSRSKRSRSHHRSSRSRRRSRSRDYTRSSHSRRKSRSRDHRSSRSRRRSRSVNGRSSRSKRRSPSKDVRSSRSRKSRSRTDRSKRRSKSRDKRDDHSRRHKSKSYDRHKSRSRSAHEKDKNDSKRKDKEASKEKSLHRDKETTDKVKKADSTSSKDELKNAENDLSASITEEVKTENKNDASNENVENNIPTTVDGQQTMGLSKSSDAVKDDRKDNENKKNDKDRSDKKEKTSEKSRDDKDREKSRSEKDRSRSLREEVRKRSRSRDRSGRRHSGDRNKQRKRSRDRSREKRRSREKSKERKRSGDRRSSREKNRDSKRQKEKSKDGDRRKDRSHEQTKKSDPTKDRDKKEKSTSKPPESHKRSREPDISIMPSEADSVDNAKSEDQSSDKLCLASGTHDSPRIEHSITNNTYLAENTDENVDHTSDMEMDVDDDSNDNITNFPNIENNLLSNGVATNNDNSKLYPDYDEYDPPPVKQTL